MCMWLPMQFCLRPGVDTGCLLLLCSFFKFGVGSSFFEPRVHWLTQIPPGSTCFHLQNTWVTTLYSHAQLSYGFWGSKLRSSHICTMYFSHWAISSAWICLLKTWGSLGVRRRTVLCHQKPRFGDVPVPRFQLLLCNAYLFETRQEGITRMPFLKKKKKNGDLGIEQILGLSVELFPQPSIHIFF